MTILSGKSKWKVRLLPNGMRLLSGSREKPRDPQEILIKQKILTESQFQNIISTMGPPARFPGDFLIQRRILSRDQCGGRGVSSRCGEVIFEIFSLQKAKYEFITGDPGDDLEMFDPQGAGVMLVFNVSTILMEAARRDDEWQRILAKVPSKREIFAPVDPSAFREPKAYEAVWTTRPCRRSRRSFDGQHTIAGIAEESTLSSSRSISDPPPPGGLGDPAADGEGEEGPRRGAEAALQGAGGHRYLPEPPRRGNGRYRHPHQAGPAPGEASEEREGRPAPRAARVPDCPLLRRSDYASVQSYVQADPGHRSPQLFPSTSGSRCSTCRRTTRTAVEMARRLVDAIKVKKEFAKGSELLLKIVDLYPSEPFLFHELADFFVHLEPARERGGLPEVRRRPPRAAPRLTRLGRPTRIASLDPSEAAALRKITEPSAAPPAGRASGFRGSRL
jgi:hypothetical protein